jgi:hypothetical protein
MADFIVSTLIAFVGVIALIAGIFAVLAGVVIVLVSGATHRAVELSLCGAAFCAIVYGSAVSCEALDLIARAWL